MYRLLAAVLVTLGLLPTLHAAPLVVVAEGEQFRPLDAKGWQVTHQDDSYASHTYGGMWMTHGGCLGAPAASDGSVAVQTVQVPQAGRYRVWSKYQAPPYFNYLHRLEVHQAGRLVHSHVYGQAGTPRLWSFSGVSDELFWYWGVDHDAAEAPAALVPLAAGPAEIRLVTVKSPDPAGARFVDFVVLTSNPADDYDGFKPYRVGSPFTNEALAASRLYLRFKNTTKAAAQLVVSRSGHYQPNYGGATAKFPDRPTPAGVWSEWVNIGPFCRLVHDEGLTLSLPGGEAVQVEFARDAAGQDAVGTMAVASGEAVSVPIDVTWRKDARVAPSRTLAAAIVEAGKTWRRANGGRKPKQVRFYGAFAGEESWVADLKDALGYNTNLPEGREQIRRAFIAQHHGSPEALRALHKALTPAQRERLHVVSFGDEIGLGKISYGDPKNQNLFRAWLRAQGVTEQELGVPVDRATLTEAPGRLAWYARRFSDETTFATYRELTRLARELFGPTTLTGANYSPHHLALCYGPLHQWIDLFRHQGMSLYWAEDYLFSVPEAPAMVSWMFAQMRCGAKYHGQPIHFYVMPHAPGQVPGFLRRNLLTAVGHGAAHVDHFWVAPAERFTENYVGWPYRDTFRTLSEHIFDTAEVEAIQRAGKVRPARVAVLTGRATDFNESRLMVPRTNDPFLRRCKNAPDQVNQTLCRKDQQYLYLGLVHAGHAVELITEDDVADGALQRYDVVYFAGEWIERRTVKSLDAWVRAGGTLHAAAGLGQRNEHDEVDPGLPALLGLKAVTTSKNAIAPRTLLELPLLEPIDTLTLDGAKVAAVGMKQVLTPGEARVLATWTGGGAAATVRRHGKGQAFAVGTLAGATWMRSGLRRIPYARGGRGTVYNPAGFDANASKLLRLAVAARAPERAVTCDRAGVEAVVLDSPAGTLLTLVNWTNEPIKGLAVQVRLPKAPARAWSVTGQKPLPATYAAGQATFRLDLDEGDFVLLPR